MNAVIPAAMAPADGQHARQDPGDGRYAATAVMVETGVVLTPENGRLVIDVHGDLAGILAIAHRKAPPARTDGAVSRALPNAGNHGQHSLPKHIGRPRGRPMWLKLLSK